MPVRIGRAAIDDGARRGRRDARCSDVLAAPAFNVDADPVQRRLHAALSVGRQRRQAVGARQRGRVELVAARRIPDVDRYRAEFRRARVHPDDDLRPRARLSRAARRRVSRDSGLRLVGHPPGRSRGRRAGRRVRLSFHRGLLRLYRQQRGHELAPWRRSAPASRSSAAAPRASGGAGEARCSCSASRWGCIRTSRSRLRGPLSSARSRVLSRRQGVPASGRGQRVRHHRVAARPLGVAAISRVRQLQQHRLRPRRADRLAARSSGPSTTTSRSLRCRTAGSTTTAASPTSGCRRWWSWRSLLGAPARVSTPAPSC